MALLNYTTKIDPDKTASEIAKILSMHGATAVMTEYDKEDGAVTALSFRIQMNEMSIQEVFLPYAVMPNDRTLAENVKADLRFLLGPGN